MPRKGPVAKRDVLPIQLIIQNSYSFNQPFNGRWKTW